MAGKSVYPEDIILSAQPKDYRGVSFVDDGRAVPCKATLLQALAVAA
jgi:hypothetical protein